MLNIGKHNTGIGNSGNNNAGMSNIGDCNSGNRNIGDNNKGNENIGARNSGTKNIGELNYGSTNIGSGNIGITNVGSNNVGNYNIGDCNFGDHNIGDANFGDYNIGKLNFGYYNNGICNWGSHCLGDFNTENYCYGCFNALGVNDKVEEKETKPKKLKFFNAPTSMTLATWRSSAAYAILETIQPNIEKLCKDISNESLAKCKNFAAYQNTFKSWWATLSYEQKNIIYQIPNFDSEIFQSITGIEFNEREKEDYVRLKLQTSYLDEALPS